MKKSKNNNKMMKITKTIFCVQLLLLYNVAIADSSGPSDIIQYQSSAEKIEPEQKFKHFTSGTGFFVSNNYIITNEHVVQGCKNITIRGAVQPGSARIQAIDKQNDLALLKTSANPERIAQLRGDEIPVNAGEEVIVMGYPLERGIRGDYLIKKAVITDPEDVYEGIKRVQFTDSVEKGNSGGPLLDDNGNVVGVVVGKMSFYLADASMQGGIEPEPVKTSSMAISLDSLRSFLSENGVYYRSDSTRYNYPDKWMERKAKQYIVNVHCMKD
jgi:serine protease Do